MPVSLHLEIALTREGIEQARRELDEIATLLDNTASRPKVQAFGKHPARRVYQRARGRRSREILELLPVGKGAALTPAELARRMDPDDDGSRLSKSSARAAIRNVQRCEAHLLAEGLIDRRIVQIDFSRYDREGAGRYYVQAEDRAVIDRAARRALAQHDG